MSLALLRPAALLRTLLVAGFSLGLMSVALAAGPTARAASPTAAADPLHAFDFFFGRWRAHNHRLVGRLVGSTQWEDFDAEVECRPLPRDNGNTDTYVTDHWPNYAGASLRFFDRTTRRWAIYWASNRTGVLEPPVWGGFDAAGVGMFEGDDSLDGKPIRVRYTWSRTRTAAPRWEQAFSADGGKSWETNWTMDFERLAGSSGGAAP